MEERIESDNDEIDLDIIREQIEVIMNPSDYEGSEDQYLQEEQEPRFEIDSNILEERSED